MRVQTLHKAPFDMFARLEDISFVSSALAFPAHSIELQLYGYSTPNIKSYRK